MAIKSTTNHPSEEKPIWISETYSQPVSIGSVTLMAREWLALAKAAASLLKS